MRQTGLGGEARPDRIQFAPPQRGEEVALQDDPLALAATEALVCEMLSPRLQSVAHLAAEAPHRQRYRVRFHQPMVQPGGPRRLDLLAEFEV
ncbi:hypothetical protein QO015_000150 [Kaistia geumhonensis]|uniref:Uncharacterized protein n=1 Tax=Kaistia geumhonensis TaxID=410839 RepID=A0ABU0M0R2_9HYPH|nr:hypothetical protein [Kaistia geumhonensis]